MSDKSKKSQGSKESRGRFRRIATKTVIALVAVGAVVAVGGIEVASSDEQPAARSATLSATTAADPQARCRLNRPGWP